MRKNKKSKKARRHAKLLKWLKTQALSEGDQHLSKIMEPNENHKHGLQAEDAPSSPDKMAQLTRIKVGNRARKNTNLVISSLRRDVKQFEDVTSSEMKKKLSDLEKKMTVQLHAVYNADAQNERIIEDIKMAVVSPHAHAAQQAKEMGALRSYNHKLRMELEKDRERRSVELAKEREDRKAMRNELRRDVERWRRITRLL